MDVVDIKQDPGLVQQYVELRNFWCEMLLTNPVDLPGTRAWLASSDVELKGLLRDGVLAGVVMLYVAKGGEISFFARERNKGTGARLLKLADDAAIARGLDRVFAWVREDNAIAARVFEKSGYVKGSMAEKLFNGRTYRCFTFSKGLKPLNFSEK